MAVAYARPGLGARSASQSVSGGCATAKEMGGQKILVAVALVRQCSGGLRRGNGGGSAATAEAAVSATAAGSMVAAVVV